MFADVHEVARLPMGKAISLCPLLLTMPDILKKSCPLYPRKRTCAVRLGMSAKCQ